MPGDDDHGEPDDASLLARIAGGDQDACSILVRRHVRAATLFAAQLLGDRDDAEDVVQAAFILACERVGELDRTRPFAHWLFGVVRRLALKARARRAHRRLLWLRWRGDADSRSTDDPVARLDAAGDLAIVWRELQILPVMQRACFELVVLRDVAVEDVAAMYEISPSTVRQHVFRARRELRAKLEPLLGVGASRWTGRKPAGQ